jgi:hypothetical protein
MITPEAPPQRIVEISGFSATIVRAKGFIVRSGDSRAGQSAVSAIVRVADANVPSDKIDALQRWFLPACMLLPRTNEEAGQD